MKYEYLIFFWQFLFSQEDVLKGSVSIEHLIEMLQLFPFSLEESEAQLLSRYLVEDSDSKYTILNLEEEATLARVRSVLKHLIGSYDLQLLGVLTTETAQILAKCKPAILDNISKLPGFRNYFCSQSQFEAAVSDTLLNNKHLDLIFQKNFFITQDLDLIDTLETFKQITKDLEPSTISPDKLAHQSVQEKSFSSKKEDTEEAVPLEQKCLAKTFSYTNEPRLISSVNQDYVNTNLEEPEALNEQKNSSFSQQGHLSQNGIAEAQDNLNDGHNPEPQDPEKVQYSQGEEEQSNLEGSYRQPELDLEQNVSRQPEQDIQQNETHSDRLVENNDPEFGLESGEEVQEGDPELKNDSRYSLDGEQFEQEEAVE